MALAIPILCCCPPESSAGIFFACFAMSNLFNNSMVFFSLSLLPTFKNICGKAILSKTDKLLIKLYDW